MRRGDPLMPPPEYRHRWRDSELDRGASRAEANNYARRWTDLWIETVRLAKADGRSWSDAHLWLVADYVEARRAAFEYQREADRRPFVEGAGGRVYAHPGLEKAAAARREAREVLGDLLLTPRSFSGAPSGDEPDEPPAGPDGDQAGL